MGTVSLSEIKPDMVLADDLRHQNGRFLLNRGTKLESKHIRMLKMWGVIEADVEGVNQKNVEEDIISALDPAIVEAAEENAHAAAAPILLKKYIKMRRLNALALKTPPIILRLQIRFRKTLFPQ
jgi:hypothetical protein